MCVIVFKPADVEPVSEEILKQCWDRNDDGAGYAVYLADSNKWRVRKGFMKWKHFIKAFRRERVTKEQSYVCHFRIKSAGKIDAGNTHPFIICDDYDKMRKLSYTTDQPVLFHNGTCGKADGDASDTMNYIKHYISPLIPYTNDEKIKQLFSNLLQDTHDKWLLVHNNTITRYNKFEEHEGAFFSNLHWKPYVVTTMYRENNYYGTGNPAGYGMFGGTEQGTKELEREGYAFTELSYENQFEWGREYTVLWDDLTQTSDEPPVPEEEEKKEEEINDGYVICPYCYEENYIGNAEFVNAGDSFCWRCGCCFDEKTNEIYMHDYELKQTYDNLKEKKDGTNGS